MKAALITEYNQIEWKEVPTPQIKENEVLVKVKYASICGSDQHIFTGDFHPRTQLPLIPGHEFSGEVAEVGNRVTKAQKGDKVTVDPIIWCGECPACKKGHYPACTSLKLIGIDMDGGFGEYVAVHEDRLFHLDENISDKEGALIEVMSIGFHASNRGDVQQGDNIAIWGAGKVGQCVLQAVKTKTNRPVFLIDTLDTRLEIAQNSYPDTITINPAKENPVERIKKETENKGVDIAFEAVGHATDVEGVPHPVRSCIQSIRGAGKVVVLGLSGQKAPLIMKELIWKEAQIIASRVSHGEFSESISNLSKRNLKAENLITAEMPASQAQEAFRMLEENPQQHLKILLTL
jgi:2-desacetyl-2-hydroxyethyl bacteriochlorophyllide A dehydrogenase